MCKFEVTQMLKSLPRYEVHTDFRISNYGGNDGLRTNLPVNKTKFEWNEIKEKWRLLGRRGRWVMLRLQEILGVTEVELFPYKVIVHYSEAVCWMDIEPKIKQVLQRSMRYNIGNPNPSNRERQLCSFAYQKRVVESSWFRDIIVDDLPSEVKV